MRPAVQAALLAATLAATLAVAAFLRFDGLGVPSFWMDEILHQGLTARAAAQPWWKWLTGFEPENGPLYYLVQLVAGDSEFAARLPAALFGLAAVLLVARREHGGAVAAVLLAVSPLHVYYSREARPYALLMLLTAALLATLLRARSLAAAIALLLAMLYTAAVAAPVLAAAAATAALCALLDRERRRWYGTVAAAAALMTALSPLLYRGATATAIATDAPALDAQFFATLARNFSVTALGTPRGDWAAALLFVFAATGAIVLAKRDKRAAAILLGMTVLPIAIALAALVWFDRWYAVRYVSPSLIGYVMLAGAGIVAVARHPALAVLLAGAIGFEAWPAAREEAFRKLDWRGIAAAIARHAKPGELVIAAEPWSEISLRYYLDPRIRLVNIPQPVIADLQRNSNPGAWLITAGFSADTATRVWMCRFPLLLASPLESFRLHYGSADVSDVVTFNDGWGDPEGAFRWAVAKRATLTVPRWGARDEVLRMSVIPAGEQTIRVTLNGHAMATLTPPAGWSEQSIALPAQFWVDGENTIAFEFAHATAIPTDPRTLAAAFQDVRLSTPLTRLTALVEHRHDETRLRPLRKDATIALIHRLGFDPSAVWPRLERGELFLDDVIDTLAWGADCQSDAQFVTTAIEVLLERPPKPHELRELAALPRDRALGRIAKWDEFRDRVLAR